MPKPQEIAVASPHQPMIEDDPSQHAGHRQAKYITCCLPDTHQTHDNAACLYYPLHLAEERYRVGKGTLLEALDAQVNFTEARSSLVRTRYDLAVADADLQRLLGMTGEPLVP